MKEDSYENQRLKVINWTLDQCKGQIIHIVKLSKIDKVIFSLFLCSWYSFDISLNGCCSWMTPLKYAWFY
jgi:hypothetical protein